jgi:hypothetical protein
VARVAARIDRGRYAYLPFGDGEAEAFLARLPEGMRYESAHLVRPDGSIRSPNSAPYRVVARMRHRLGPLVPDGPGPRRYP